MKWMIKWQWIYSFDVSKVDKVFDVLLKRNKLNGVMTINYLLWNIEEEENIVSFIMFMVIWLINVCISGIIFKMQHSGVSLSLRRNQWKWTPALLRIKYNVSSHSSTLLMMLVILVWWVWWLMILKVKMQSSTCER